MIWFQKAVDNDKDALSQLALGNMYRKGLGVEKNYDLARKYYSELAEQGNIQALEVYRRCSAITDRLG